MSNIAFDKEVYERAKKIAKDKYDIDLSYEEVEELDNIVSNYIREKIDEDPNLFGVYLRGLGTAYYTKIECTKRMETWRGKGVKEEVWRKRAEAIKQSYEENDSRKNRKRGYRLYNMEKPIVKRASRRGYKIQDIEDIQNEIK